MVLQIDLDKPVSWARVLVLTGFSIGISVMVTFTLLRVITGNIDTEVDIRDAFLQQQINNINDRLNSEHPLEFGMVPSYSEDYPMPTLPADNDYQQLNAPKEPALDIIQGIES